MNRRLWRVAVSVALAATCIGAPTAQAFFTSDVTNWSLNESWKTYGGGTNYHISSDGDGSADFRWVTNLTKTTVLSANRCSDYSQRGSTTISGGDTTFHQLFGGGLPTDCFVLRGKTLDGTTDPHDGRLRR